MSSEIIDKCKTLLKAYSEGKLGDTTFPEEQHPSFENGEERLLYFTLPMSLNYRRSSKDLWKSALQTSQDPETKVVFELSWVVKNGTNLLRERLSKYALALLPKVHTNTWRTIAMTILKNWGSLGALISETKNDFLGLKQIVQIEYKKGFPYLSGPKIFNYWSLVLTKYGNVPMKNRDWIEIAPDTHIIKGSVKLGVITKAEAKTLTKNQISTIWRDLLGNTGIDPIDMHPPLWFWSKNGFVFKID